jgi:hypothetical protein
MYNTKLGQKNLDKKTPVPVFKKGTIFEEQSVKKYVPMVNKLI